MLEVRDLVGQEIRDYHDQGDLAAIPKAFGDNELSVKLIKNKLTKNGAN